MRVIMFGICNRDAVLCAAISAGRFGGVFNIMGYTPRFALSVRP